MNFAVPVLLAAVFLACVGNSTSAPSRRNEGLCSFFDTTLLQRFGFCPVQGKTITAPIGKESGVFSARVGGVVDNGCPNVQKAEQVAVVHEKSLNGTESCFVTGYLYDLQYTFDHWTTEYEDVSLVVTYKGDICGTNTNYKTKFTFYCTKNNEAPMPTTISVDGCLYSVDVPSIDMCMTTKGWVWILSMVIISMGPPCVCLGMGVLLYCCTQLFGDKGSYNYKRMADAEYDMFPTEPN